MDLGKFKKLFKRYPEKGKEFLEKDNYKNFESMPDDLKSPEEYEKWLEKIGYHKFKNVPIEKMTQKMCEIAYRIDRRNINYMPHEYITEKMLSDALMLLDREMAKMVLNPLYQINSKLPNEEDRLKLLTMYPEAMGGCDFKLVEQYYKQESKGLIPKELKALQNKIRVAVPQYYYPKLDFLFEGKEEPKIEGEVFHTDKGTVNADGMYSLINNGAEIKQLQDFDEKDLLIHGTWINQMGCFVIYEYKGNDFMYQQLVEGEPIFGQNVHFTHYKGQRAHMPWSEVSIYDLVKSAESIELGKNPNPGHDDPDGR